MTVLFAFTVSVALVYLCYSVCVTDGVPESLSATYYELGDDGWLFQLVMLVLGSALLPVWLEACGGRYEWLAFLSCGGLLYTGAAPAFRLKLEGAVHYSAAVVCCVSALAWLLLSGEWPLVLWWSVIGWMCWLQWGRYMWWLEVCIIGMVFCALV